MAEQDLRELEATLSLQNAILSCRSFNDVRRDVLKPLANYVEAETGCFLQFLPPGMARREIGRNSCYEVDEASHSAYISHYFRLDPATTSLALRKEHMTKVFCTSDICDYSFFTRSEIYNDFLKPNHLHHILVAAIRTGSPSGERLIFGFQRPRRASPFSEQHKARLERMTSALSCSLQSMMLQEEMALREVAISQYETSHPETGLLFFDEQMTLLFGNQKGLKYLKIGSADASNANADGTLAKIREACHKLKCLGNPHESVEIPSPPGEDMVATVRGWHDPHGRLLFSIHIDENETQAIFKARCADLGMTNREIDIVRLVAAGLSNADIANRLFISIRTVENHLRAIYSKGGVNRRTQLLHRLGK